MIEGPFGCGQGRSGVEGTLIGLYFVYNLNDMKSISVIPKKRGRPATGKDPLIAFRAPESLTRAVDEYAAAKMGGAPRSEAIRAILRDWLESNGYVPK
ncbi:MAG: ribbon-helix-helix domain-containing protein [Nitratireductor sp.]